MDCFQIGAKNELSVPVQDSFGGGGGCWLKTSRPCLEKEMSKEMHRSFGVFSFHLCEPL